jgi:superfamily II DNA/RNA helicase
VRATPRKEDRQTLLFSATFTQDIMNLASSGRLSPSPSRLNPSGWRRHRWIKGCISFLAESDSPF